MPGLEAQLLPPILEITFHMAITIVHLQCARHSRRCFKCILFNPYNSCVNQVSPAPFDRRSGGGERWNYLSKVSKWAICKSRSKKPRTVFHQSVSSFHCLPLVSALTTELPVATHHRLPSTLLLWQLLQDESLYVTLPCHCHFRGKRMISAFSTNTPRDPPCLVSHHQLHQQ